MEEFTEKSSGFLRNKEGSIYTFYPSLFLFFIFINIACYWWALFTAFPEFTRGIEGQHYFKVQFPVGFMGALFDSLSFFVTLYIIRRALRAKKNLEYVSHLSLDLVIAILATFWVLFVFSFAGWLVHLIESVRQDLGGRTEDYGRMLVDALANPFANKRNIYFGLIMGVSAMLPTCGHLFIFLRSCYRTVFLQKAKT
ncbi:MAG: hypothetical protein MAG551_02529 [Candidatus Scalindua arabica]|uniref:Uncharacterized protein n=1 Tax=Candidatus Scalindua arabica TaxID=1127984 RepID=A0A942A742_9BACT|nr:hypothetical protein [Candidatus Scalindua arabica]